LSDRFWLHAAIHNMTAHMFHTFHVSNANKILKFGSDCTGADAAFHAAIPWTTHIQSTPVNEFASEAPGATGPMLFQLLNSPPKILFSDVLARGFSGPCIVSGRRVATPMDVDMYTAGTMCTDYSGFNTLNPKKNLDCSVFLFGPLNSKSIPN